MVGTVGTVASTSASAGVFGYFFQAGLGLAFGLSVVLIPAVKLIRGQKLFNFNFRRKF